jgi:hypothetical protein
VARYDYKCREKYYYNCKHYDDINTICVLAEQNTPKEPYGTPTDQTLRSVGEEPAQVGRVSNKDERWEDGQTQQEEEEEEEEDRGEEEEEKEETFNNIVANDKHSSEAKPVQQADVTNTMSPPGTTTTRTSRSPSSFISYTSSGKHANTDNEASCDAHVSRVMLKQWRDSCTELCGKLGDNRQSRISACVLKSRHDKGNNPTVHIYENVWTPSLSAPLKIHSTCRENVKLDRDIQHGYASPLDCANPLPNTVYRVSRFDVWNPYEAMHSYINSFETLAMLDIDPSTVIVVLNDEVEKL